MNVIDWLNATGDYLVSDRPDIYASRAEAISELMVAMDALREPGVAKVATISFTSYMLTRLEDEGMEEFILSRKAATLLLDHDAEVSVSIGHITEVELPHILDGWVDPTPYS